jgi:hypothetical protein
MFQVLAFTAPKKRPEAREEPGFGDGERYTVASLPLATV